MSCHLQHFNSAPGISLARLFSASAAVLALVLLLFWCWFAFCLGPFLVVMFGLLVEMFMKQLGPRRRRTRTMSGWVRNDCKRNFKDAPSCQLSPYLPLCHSFQHLLLLSAGSSWQQKRLESCYAFAWFQSDSGFGFNWATCSASQLVMLRVSKSPRHLAFALAPT